MEVVMTLLADESIVLAKRSGNMLRDAMGKDAIVNLMGIGCMDHRVCHKQRHPIRKKFEVHNYVSMTFAGGAFSLADPDHDHSLENYDERWRISRAARTMVAQGFKVALKKKGNNISRILLATHSDCFYVAGEGYKFDASNREEEAKVHRRKREEAAKWAHKELLMLTFEDIEIWSCYYPLSKDGVVEIEDLHRHF